MIFKKKLFFLYFLFTSCSGSELLNAVYSKDFDKVKFLVESGKDVNESTETGSTPLMLASYSEKNDILRYLIKSGANVNACNNKGQNSLLIAISKKRLDNVRDLLAAGANINHIDNIGFTPLTLAAMNKSPEILNILLEDGDDIYKLYNFNDTTKLIYFILTGKNNTVNRYLLDKRLNIDLNTALLFAFKCKNTEASKSLLFAGAQARSLLDK